MTNTWIFLSSRVLWHNWLAWHDRAGLLSPVASAVILLPHWRAASCLWYEFIWDVLDKKDINVLRINSLLHVYLFPNSCNNKWCKAQKIMDWLTDWLGFNHNFSSKQAKSYGMLVLNNEINEKVENVTWWEYAKLNHYNKKLFNLVFVGETIRHESSLPRRSIG